MVWWFRVETLISCLNRHDLSAENILECPITTQLFLKNGYAFTGVLKKIKNVRDILCNTDVITCIAKLIAHSLVGKLL